MRSIILAAMPIISLAGLSEAAAMQSAAAGAAASPPTVTAAQVDVGEEKVVCRREQPTSWRTAGARICMTRRAWKASEAESRSLTDKLRERSNIGRLPAGS